MTIDFDYKTQIEDLKNQDGVILLERDPWDGDLAENYSDSLEVYMNEDGRATIGIVRDYGDSGTTFNRWHGRELAWGLNICGPAIADDGWLESMCEKIMPFLQRVHDGHSVDWDGSNNVGRLTDDAKAAQDDIYEIVSTADLASDMAVWDMLAWIADVPDSEVMDFVNEYEHIEEAEAAYKQEALSDRVYLVGGIADRLAEIKEADAD